jgi:hypothetical protein
MEVWEGLLLIMGFIATLDWKKLKYLRRKTMWSFYNLNKEPVYRSIPHDKFKRQRQ